MSGTARGILADLVSLLLWEKKTWTEKSENSKKHRPCSINFGPPHPLAYIPFADILSASLSSFRKLVDIFGVLFSAAENFAARRWMCAAPQTRRRRMGRRGIPLFFVDSLLSEGRGLGENEMAALASSICQVCDADATSRCAACKEVFYCSVDHQRSDWKDHKEDCLRRRAAQKRVAAEKERLKSVG